MSSSKRKQRGGDSCDVRLSKALSWLLRHGAQREGLHMDDGAFVDVEMVLARHQFKGHTIDDIRRVVNTNDKQRFALRCHPETGKLQIRANQGHTIPVDVEGLLTPLDVDSVPENVIHGTYISNWDSIRVEGLHRKKRNHIHFAPGFPGESGVISGMRRSCEVYVVIDVKKALQDGMTFFKSANNVILSPGDANGYIKPEYFKEVWQAKPKKRLM